MDSVEIVFVGKVQSSIPDKYIPLDSCTEYAWIPRERANCIIPVCRDCCEVVIWMRVFSTVQDNLGLSKIPANNDFLTGAETIQFVFPEGIKTYYVSGVVLFATHATITVTQGAGDYLFASSSNGGTDNWSLRAYGNYTSSDGTEPGFDPNSQGKFHALSNLEKILKVTIFPEEDIIRSRW